MDIYEWRGDLFDGDCLLLVLTEDDRWSADPILGDGSARNLPAEGVLEQVAEAHSINRDDPEEMRMKDFPVWVATPPIPDGFCRVCLHFFRESPSESGDTAHA